MKVVFINQPQDSLVAGPEQRGSVGIVDWELARQLSQHHEVAIYCPRTGNQPLREHWHGIEIRRVRFVAKKFHKGLQLLSGRFSRRRHYFDSALYFREYYLQVVSDLRKCAPDVIHLPQQLQFVTLLKRALPGVKVVVHMHQDELAYLDYERARHYLSVLDAVVTVSDYVTTRAQARFPEFAERIHTIGNGVDVERFRPAANGRVARQKMQLLFVGRVAPDKGVHLLMDAFEILAREKADLELTIVGRAGMLPFDIISLLLRGDSALNDIRQFYGRSFWSWLTREVLGQSKSYVKALRARLSGEVAARVCFAGVVSLEELIRTYQGSDLLVLPSLWHESYGLPVAEAMASGVPVLASRCGGVPELVDEPATGVLVPRGDLNALVSKLRALTANPARLEQMGLAARARAESRLTWTRSARILEQVYAGVTTAKNVTSTVGTQPLSARGVNGSGRAKPGGAACVASRYP